MGKTLTDHHNDGQSHRANNDGYNPPHGLLENVLTWHPDSSRKMNEENSAYRSGWDNADKQAD